MSAMKPTERAQFLSRVLGYERLAHRAGPAAQREDRPCGRGSTRCGAGLPDPAVLQEAVAARHPALCGGRGPRRRGARTGEGRRSPPRGAGAAVDRGAETARGGCRTRVGTAAGPARRGNGGQGGRAAGVRAAGGHGGSGALHGARGDADATPGPARGSGIPDARCGRQYPARSQGRGAQGTGAPAEGTREAAREGAQRGGNRECHDGPQYGAGGARLHSPVTRGAPHALGAGYAGSQDEARGTSRPVQGSGRATEADRECGRRGRLSHLRPPAPARNTTRCLGCWTGRPRK